MNLKKTIFLIAALLSCIIYSYAQENNENSRGISIDSSFTWIDAAIRLPLEETFFYHQDIVSNRAPNAGIAPPQNGSSSNQSSFLNLNNFDPPGDEFWDKIPFQSIDAALTWINGKAYVFSGTQYVRYDTERNQVDSGYPKEINDWTWPGLGFETIDAAFYTVFGKVFFFSGNEYVQYDIKSDEADPGYPRQISNQNWNGLSFTQVDAAVHKDGGQFVFFFSGEDYMCYDLYSNQAVFNQPRRIAEDWPDLHTR